MAASIGRADRLTLDIESARSKFRPIGEEDVRLAVDEMRSAQGPVARFMRDRPEYAEGWRQYLHWDKQNRQLADPSSLDVPFWKSVLLLESVSSAGLDRPEFQQHRAAMRNLINVLQAAADPALRDSYEATLDSLSVLLESGATGVDSDQAQNITQLLEQLDKQGQGTELLGEIKKHFSRRNVLIYVPEKSIDRDRHGTVERSFQVSERIGGASVRGSGVMTAQYDWSPVTSDNSAIWRMDVEGTSVSRTSAYQNGVTVRNKSTIPFHSQGSVTFDLSGFRVSDFSTSGNLRLRTTSIRTPFRGLRNRIARRKALKQQASTRGISGRNARRGISNSFRREVESELIDANRNYREDIVLPLNCFDLFPTDSTVQTTSDSVQIGLRLANSRQLAAQHGVDNFYSGNQIRLAVHQSALNNLATSLAGQTRSLRKMLLELRPSDEQEVDDEQNDVDITFSDLSPIIVSLDEGMIRVRILGENFRRGGQKYRAMEIQFHYDLRYEQGEHYLSLAAKPIVAHPLGSGGSRPKLGIRDLSLRRILLSILERDLPEKIALDEIELPFQVDLLGPLRTVHFQSDNGWALLEATRAENSETVLVEARDTVVPVSFRAEDAALTE